MTLKRIPIAWRDPVEAFAPLRDAPFALLMHGARREWSYICANPVEVLALDAIEGGDGLELIEALSASVPFERPENAPPFCGGWAGLLSYEFGRALLPKLEGGPQRGAWPDVALGFYQEFIAFNHDAHTAEYWNWGWRASPADRLSLLELLSLQQPPEWEGALSTAPPTPLVSREDYERRIARAVAYVHAGDCFQTNISQRFEFEMPKGAHAFDLTRRLDKQSAAPFSAYFRLPGLALASNSPERFLKVRPLREGGLKVTTKPIKGTRPRGQTPDEDAALAEELQASEKDRAENLMIVDLMRNDLSRVSKPGSVKVPKLNALESYANVHHLVSTVEAELQDGRGPVDLIRSAFPGGSITGAPKIRAMQIIAELEQEARGPYCGSLIWITPDQWMDSSILIRSTALEETAEGGWRGEFRSGGGIVADSDPSEEYQETLDKAGAIIRAVTEVPAKQALLFEGAVRQTECVVQCDDRSFLLGDGCFETLRIIDGVCEGVREHIELLRRSLDVLKIKGVPEDSVLTAAIQELAQATPGEAALRITVSRGAGGRGAGALHTQPVTVFSISPLEAGRPYAPMSVATCSIRRNETSPLSTLKSTSYGDNLAARREAVYAGADEALMLNTAGRVACLAMGNLFLRTAADNWATPLMEEGARPGYMRRMIIDQLKSEKTAFEERPIELDELLADGVILYGANSLWGLRPIKDLNGRNLQMKPVQFGSWAMGRDD